MVLSPHEVDVIRGLDLIAVEIRRRVGTAADGEFVCHPHVEKSGREIEHVNAEAYGARHVRRRRAVDGEPVESGMDGIHQRRAYGVRIAQQHGLHAIVEARSRSRQNIICIVGRICVVHDHVTAGERVTPAHHPIHLAHILVLAVGIGDPIHELTAGIAGNRNQLQQVRARWAEAADRDLIIRKRRLAVGGIDQLHRFVAGLAGRRFHGTEVPAEHRLVRHIGNGAGRRGAHTGGLETIEQEDLVFLMGPPMVPPNWLRAKCPAIRRRSPARQSRRCARIQKGRHESVGSDLVTTWTTHPGRKP